ncbi:hypothetical protein ONZ43_g4424 [Nemania bipapillata]|uniref:Uncharacterized protein n=1 Tax=Nemania bipapillata TaxID=110536 RepID=A0ACC2IMV0_9PEZI|nr:hypothetical protein ONZ43_g4424 [Nemania bipapillata]
MGWALDIDDVGNENGWTPLILAVDYGENQITQYLIRQRPSPNPDLRTTQGSTALIKAAQRGYADLIDLVVTRLRANVDIADDNNTTAVLWAAKKRRWGCVIQLINHHARVELSNKDDEIALHFAIRTRNLRIVNRVLRSDRSGISLKAVDMQGRWPLHIAAETGDINIIQLLIHFGARNSVYDYWGNMPSNIAFSRGFYQAESILIRAP